MEGETFKRKFESVSEAEKLTDNDLELIIKYYEQSKSGISK